MKINGAKMDFGQLAWGVRVGGEAVFLRVRLYVAAVIDLFSRRVVGWSMSAAMTAQLVTDALRNKGNVPMKWGASCLKPQVLRGGCEQRALRICPGLEHGLLTSV